MGYHPLNTSDDSTSASDPITSPGAVTTDSAPATPRLAEIRTKPWLTWIIATVCVGIFVGVNLSGDASSWEGMRRWGAPPAQSVWDGASWGLVTSVFVHLAIWHLAFNLYWLWILGRILETTIGSTRWLAFFVASAIVSSAAQLAVSGATGIGLSGVIYAVFGFMWVGQRAYPGFARSPAPADRSALPGLARALHRSHGPRHLERRERGAHRRTSVRPRDRLGVRRRAEGDLAEARSGSAEPRRDRPCPHLVPLELRVGRGPGLRRACARRLRRRRRGLSPVRAIPQADGLGHPEPRSGLHRHGG